MNSLATTRRFLLGATLGLVSIFGITSTTVAEPSIKIDVDDAKLVKLSGEPSTVVVSNPMFADASVQGKNLVVVGKNTGRTKVIVLDFDGNQLANMMVKVQRTEDHVVSVYRAGTRRTMTCEPFCDQPLVVNDEFPRFKDQSEQINYKTKFSTGAASTSGGEE